MTSSPLILGPLLRYVDEVSASLWFETRDAATVSVSIATGGTGASTFRAQTFRAQTFAVHDHHYALVEVDGLEPGSVTAYTVEIAGTQVWPPANSDFPASVIATLRTHRPLHLAFGSCRTSVPHDRLGNRTHGVDALRAYALRLAATGQAAVNAARPDLVLFLGDQVYADMTSEAMQVFIRGRREISEPPGEELADFEEYAHLYELAWTDPANRWLLSTVPTAMIFDDHDIRDDWNASLSWKRQMETTSWWHGRIVAGLASYWVYQHLGNLSPVERASDEIWQRVCAHNTAEIDQKYQIDEIDQSELDLSEVLDAFAARCDQHPSTYRWSYCRDFTDTRLIVLDSRTTRVLDPSRRALLDESETAWLSEHLQGGFRHVLIGTSLPFLLPTGLQRLESWNEAISEGAWGRPAAALGERMRQAVDLEHWGAFQRSFHEVAALATELADGRRGDAPDTIMFLSGDVHYSYVEEVERGSGSRIVQAVCSPIRNPLPVLLRSFSAVLSYGASRRLSGLLARSARVPEPPFRWKGVTGPWFDNCLASLRIVPDGVRLTWQTGVVDGQNHEHPRVRTVAEITLGPRPPAAAG
ncbi:alkaline phosphatase family protein [Cryobacterium frigoriphilum]|uniref:Alkaline phosphatase family protein n=1 Tax=Cryobacterium frigoriphilum TaxID=1259150 RepID=A0A4R9A828_9MICO|nr:alkaline phosphatase D family protein [Cryobacterium frigoriphilum]TFD54002.1 alkaline phosphatase family protein [Cryobacterium frigoriphilum]